MQSPAAAATEPAPQPSAAKTAGGAGAVLMALHFMRRHLRLTAIAGFFGVSMILGALGAFDEKAVPEDRSSPGYSMVRHLDREGLLDNFKAVEAKSGWESEYSLNDGEVHLRFKGDQMEYEDDGTADDSLTAAIDRAALKAGFVDQP